MKRVAAFLFIFLIAASGCGKQIPKPETVHVKAETIENKPKMIVKHIVSGKNIFIECNIPNVSLYGQNRDRNIGKILLFVNGQLYEKYDTAAFIVKDLNPGTHQIVVEIVKQDNQPTGLKEAFSVTIN